MGVSNRLVKSSGLVTWAALSFEAIFLNDLN